MDIFWLGHSAFRLKGKQGTVITDPFNPEKVGLGWSKQKAEVVTVSHQHEDHNYVEAITESVNRPEKGPFVISGPGEYEAGGISVHGWQTYHDDANGTKRGANVMYLIEVDRVRVLHLGDLGHELSDKLIEDIGQVDVLLVPVGGEYTIDASMAVKVVNAVEPGYVVPMHYRVEGMNPQLAEKLAGVEAFLKDMGLNGIEPLEKLSVSRDDVPEEPKIVLLKF